MYATYQQVILVVQLIHKSLVSGPEWPLPQNVDACIQIVSAWVSTCKHIQTHVDIADTLKCSKKVGKSNCIE